MDIAPSIRHRALAGEAALILHRADQVPVGVVIVRSAAPPARPRSPDKALRQSVEVILHQLPLDVTAEIVVLVVGALAGVGADAK